MSQWQGDPAQPLVSICCITYNHEPYIADALEGFLIQETNFPFEILIHDDASTDRTADIIRKYEAAYPALIKPIYQIENQHSKGNRPGLINMRRVKGKYISLCEGDDYWIDPLKLKKQVVYLEKNEDVGLIHTNGFFHYTTTKKRKIVADNNKIKSILDHSDKEMFLAILLGKFNVLTCSTCVRSSILGKIDFDNFFAKNFKMGDTFLWLEFAHASKAVYFPEPMVVHNILEESASKSKDMKKILAFSKSGFELEKYVADKYNLGPSIKRKISCRRNQIFLDIAFRGHLQEEGFKAYKELVKFKHPERIDCVDYIKYMTLKWPILFFITPKLIKAMNRISTMKVNHAYKK